MAQIRQRHVNIQVTSEDPTNKVFKGIYADSEHTMLLSSNKSYEFDINAGQSKELYIRYSQKPVTITFKGVTEGSYKVTGNFGEVNVSSEDVTANVEFLTDTSPYVDVTFSSIESTTEGYEIGDMRVGGALVHSLPYYLQNAVPGQKIEVSVEVGKTTTTTTKSPVTLIFTAFPNNSEHGTIYTSIEIDGATSSVSNLDSGGYARIDGIKNNIKINNISNQDNNFRYTSVNIGYYNSSSSLISSEELTLPCTIDLTDQKFASYRPSYIYVSPGEYVEGGESVITSTSTGPAPILNILADEISAGEVYPCVVEISGGNYGGGSFITINNSSESIVLSINTSYMIRSIKAPNGYYIPSIRGVNSSPTTLPYSFTTLETPNTYSITIVDFIVTTTTTTTPAPAVLKLQSNADGTVVRVTSDGIPPKEVNLEGTTQSSVVINMIDAPLVDA